MTSPVTKVEFGFTQSSYGYATVELRVPVQPVIVADSKPGTLQRL